MKTDTPKNPWLESLKEVARLLLLALPAIVLQVLNSDPTLSSTAIGGLLVLILRGLDSYIHNNPNIALKGISPI
jgi:hypothetical protein